VPKIKLTAKAIEQLKAPDPSGRQRLFWDTELRGFGVLVSGKTNAKSFIVQRDLPGGRARRVTVGPVNVLPLDKARTQAELVLADLYRGLDPKAARRVNITLRQALDDYLTANKSIRDKTRKGYRSIERYLPTWLDRPLREITGEMIEDRHRAIAAEIKAGGKNRGEATANGTMRAFRLLYGFAAERSPDLPANPVRRLRRAWFPVARRERYVTGEQLPAFYKAVVALPNPIARDYLLLLLFTGLRRNEAATLRWDDIDLKEHIIRLPAARTKVSRKLDLPMSDVVFGIFVERQRLGRDARDYVFPSNSKAGHIVEPKFPLNLVALASGVRVSAHDLRRTYITVAESTDISPIALKALVNHSLGGDVTSGYIQMTAERLREPAQKVTDKLITLTEAPSLPESVEKLFRYNSPQGL
jgi:integrase